MRWTIGSWGRGVVALLGIGAVGASCMAKDVEPPKQPLNAATATAGGGGGPPELTPVASAQLDSGNVAYRAKQYEVALRHYRAAATAAPQHAAPWYGVYMVGEATSNRALIDSANAMVATRSGAAISESAMAKAHGESGGAAPSGALPSGHPALSPDMPPGHPVIPKSATPPSADKKGTPSRLED
jgi:hypothetical protein